MPNINEVFGWVKPLPTVRRKCPVTGGRETRMTRASFARLCLGRREEESDICRRCGGKVVPDEVEFIDLQELMSGADNHKECDMSMYGECEICGEKKKIRSVRNKNACATCEHIWRAANVQPDLMLRALADAKGDDYLRRAVGVPEVIKDDGLDDLSAADVLVERIRQTYMIEGDVEAIGAFVDNLVAEVKANQKLMDKAASIVDDAGRRLHAAEQAISDIRTMMGIDTDDMSALEAIQRLKIDMKTLLDSYQAKEREVDTLLAVRDEWNDLVIKLGQIRAALHAEPDADLVQQAEVVNHLALLFNQVEAVLGIDGQDSEEAPQLIAEMLVREKQLLQKIADLEAIVDGDQIQPTIGEIVPDTRTSTLLDLALDVIAGRVSGIDAERIAALR